MLHSTQMEMAKEFEGKLPMLNYLRAILDFGFFSFTIPFRIKWTKTRGYFIQINRYHQVLCCIIQILVIYESIAWLTLVQRTSFVAENPYHYMRVAQLLKCTAFCMVFIYTFWIKKTQFGILLKQTQALDFVYESHRSDWKTLAIAYGICLYAVIWAFGEFCALNFGLIPLESGSGGKISMLVQEAQNLYLFPAFINGNGTHVADTNQAKIHLDMADIIVTIIHTIVVLPHYVCVNSADKIVLLLAIFCRCLVIDFVTFAKNSGKQMEEVLLNYEALKEKFRVLNDVLGMLILFFVGGCLPFYPTWTGIIFFHKDATWFQFAQFISFFGMFFLILGVAADVNLKAGEFYVWVSSNEIRGRGQSRISSAKINALMIDMYSEQIALRGRGFFKMTYGFFGTVLSIIVTYTFIIVQFQMTTNSKEPK